MKKCILIILLLIPFAHTYSQFELGELETTFTPPHYIGYHANSFEVADLNNDGFPDIIAERDWGDIDSISWLKNLGNFEFSSAIGLALCHSDPYTVIKAGDINSDGLQDLVVGYVNSIISYKNVGDVNFADGDTISLDINHVGGLVVADVDGDSDLDIVVGEYLNERLTLYRNDGVGNYGEPITIEDDGLRIVDVVTADIDGDGDVDILRGTSSEPKIAWYENVDGNFETRHEIEGFVNGLNDLDVADFNNDGDIDVLSASYTDGRICYFENIGEGNFAERFELRNDNQDRFWVIGVDIDNNGRPNVFCNIDTYTDFSNGIEWFELGEDGETIFYYGFRYLNISGYLEHFDTDVLFHSLTPSDLDNDGDLDVILSSHPEGIRVSENLLYTASIQKDKNEWAKVVYDQLNEEILITINDEGVNNYSVSLYSVEGRCIYQNMELSGKLNQIPTTYFTDQLLIVVVQDNNGLIQVNKVVIN